MKKIALFSLLAAAIMIVAPRPAYAGDKGLAILGGVIGGLIIADALDGDSHHHTSVHVGHRDGYWRDVPYDVWIEGRWVVSNRHYRHPTCHYVAGHYETRVRKVWVSHRSRDRHYSHRDRRDYRRYSHHSRRHDNRRNDSRRHNDQDRDRKDRNDRRGHR